MHEIDELLWREQLGLIRMILKGLNASDLRLAYSVIAGICEWSKKYPGPSLRNAEKLRWYLLTTVERLRLESLVRIADRLKNVGFHRIGVVKL